MERFRLLSSVEKITENILGSYFTGSCTDYFHNKIVWLMQTKDNKSLTSQESAVSAITGREAVFVGGMLETVQQSCMETLCIRISFVLHGTPLDAGKLPEAFQLLDRILSVHASTDSGFVITDSPFALPLAGESSGVEIFP